MTQRFNIVNLPVLPVERDRRIFPFTSYSNVLSHFNSPFKAHVSKVFPLSVCILFCFFPILEIFLSFMCLLYVSALTTLTALCQ